MCAIPVCICILLALAQPASGRRLLIILDQGHLARASVPAMLRTAGDLLTAAGGAATTVAIVSGDRIVYPDADARAIAVSLSGEGGFVDDLRRQYGLTEAEAADIWRGNESVRDTVARRLCAASTAACGADVRAAARTVLAAARDREAATLTSLQKIVERHSLPRTVVVVTDRTLTLDRSLGSPVVLRPGDSGADAIAAPRSPVPARRAGGRPAMPLVDRATSHVQRFVSDAAFLVAEERYTQEVKSRAGSYNLPPSANVGITVDKRELESEVALVQMVDRQVWILARDVMRVDGKPVPESERQPIPSAAAASMTEAVARLREVAERGARFNIGPIQRNINVPTLALWFLTPGIRDLFDLDRDGDAIVDGVRCDVVRYRERGVGMLRVDGRPVPARGRFWIARDSAAVLRTELVLSNLESGWPGRGQPAGGRASIAVAYRFEPAVESWVPARMEERYEYPARRDLDWIVGVATYSNYRRFTVGTKIK